MTLDLHHDLALVATASQARHAPRHSLYSNRIRMHSRFICVYLRSSAVGSHQARGKGEQLGVASDWSYQLAAAFFIGER
jgi:hypothetical protein